MRFKPDCPFFAIGLPHCIILLSFRNSAKRPFFEFAGALMSFDSFTPQEARSIRAAAIHRKLGSAWTEILVSMAVIVSICAIVFIVGTNVASAAVPNLITIDDSNGDKAIFTVVGITVLLMMLAPFAFNGLTPGHARRRRTRR
jgi:hypothetical protein